MALFIFADLDPLAVHSALASLQFLGQSQTLKVFDEEVGTSVQRQKESWAEVAENKMVNQYYSLKNSIYLWSKLHHLRGGGHRLHYVDIHV